jgi:hypothetical protein
MLVSMFILGWTTEYTECWAFSLVFSGEGVGGPNSADEGTYTLGLYLNMYKYCTVLCRLQSANIYLQIITHFPLNSIRDHACIPTYLNCLYVRKLKFPKQKFKKTLLRVVFSLCVICS